MVSDYRQENGTLVISPIGTEIYGKTILCNHLTHLATRNGFSATPVTEAIQTITSQVLIPGNTRAQVEILARHITNVEALATGYKHSKFGDFVKYNFLFPDRAPLCNVGYAVYWGLQEDWSKKYDRGYANWVIDTLGLEPILKQRFKTTRNYSQEQILEGMVVFAFEETIRTCDLLIWPPYWTITQEEADAMAVGQKRGADINFRDSVHRVHGWLFREFEKYAADLPKAPLILKPQERPFVSGMEILNQLGDIPVTIFMDLSTTNFPDIEAAKQFPLRVKASGMLGDAKLINRDEPMRQIHDEISDLFLHSIFPYAKGEIDLDDMVQGLPTKWRENDLGSWVELPFNLPFGSFGD